MRIDGSFLAVLATMGFVAALSCSDDNSASPPTSETTEPQVTYGCSTPPGPPDLQVPVQVLAAGVCGYDDGLGQATYGVVVQNVGEETLNHLSFAVDVEGPGGVRAGRSVAHHVYELAPGEQIGVGYLSVVGGIPAGLELRMRAEQSAFVDEPEADAEVAVSNVTTAVQGDARTTSFTLASTYPFPLQGVDVYAVYRDAAGVIVGGEADVVDRVEAQGTATHTITSTYLNPAVTQAEVYVNENPAYPWE
jgi:hypothetical protein